MAEKHSSDDIEGTAFYSWLERTAASEGVSKDELINEMMSYYWIFNELSKTIGDGAGIQGPGREGAAVTDVESGPNEEAEGTAGGERQERDGGTGAGATQGPDSQPAGTGVDEAVASVAGDLENLGEVVESIEGLREELAAYDPAAGEETGPHPWERPAAEPGPAGETRAGTDADVEELADQAAAQDRLIAEIREAQEALRTQVDDLAATVTGLSETTADAESVSALAADTKQAHVELTRLAETVEQLRDEAVEPAAVEKVQETTAGTARELESLKVRVEGLAAATADAAAVSDLEHRTGETARTVSALEDRVSELAAELEALSEATVSADRFSRLSEATGETARDVEALKDTVAELEALEDRVAALQRAQERGRVDREAFEADVEDEFAEIEAVFETVLERLESLESRFDDWVEAYEADMATLQTRFDRRDRLAALRSEAADRGITEATCSECGESVPLGLLDAPHCPGCDRTLGAFEESWLPLKGAVVHPTERGDSGEEARAEDGTGLAAAGLDGAEGGDS